MSKYRLYDKDIELMEKGDKANMEDLRVMYEGIGNK